MTTESPLKMMKNAFCLTLKLLSFLNTSIFALTFWSYKKRLDKKAKVNFELYEVVNWITNYYNTHIARYLKSEGNETMKFAQLKEYCIRNIFLENSCTKCDAETSPTPFFLNQI